jgi:polysaccharide pyruvyl transferase WcaK-like protein
MQNSIVLFNLKYSPNLGDGVIALCLENELRRHFVSRDVHSIDLAGRTQWTTPTGGSKRAAALSLLRLFPPWAGEAAVRTILGVQLRRRLLQFYSEAVRGCSFAVFGGGQLFQDRDLNFPLKISAAAETCNAAGVPFGVYGVGATVSHSQAGRRLFNRVLTACQSDVVFARDEVSVARLKDLGAPCAKLCFDPGLLASDLWPSSLTYRNDRPTVGLCITHPAVLRHHGGVVSSSPEAVIDRTIALVNRLTADKQNIVCFTNGAGEDELFLSQCHDRLRQIGIIGDQVVISPRCKNPAELARLVASFDVVIAHRMHACILAYSYRIPAIGLRWDPKLQAFFDSVGLDDVLDLERASNDEIASKVSAALAAPISLERHRTALELARSGVREMADELKKVIQSSRAGYGFEAVGSRKRAVA